MSRYIDLDKVSIEDIPNYYGGSCRLGDIKNWLDSLPIEDVSAIEYGKWIAKNPIGSMRFECSKCRIEYYGVPSRYCSFCGAKMILGG